MPRRFIEKDVPEKEQPRDSIFVRDLGNGMVRVTIVEIDRDPEDNLLIPLEPMPQPKLRLVKSPPPESIQKPSSEPVNNRRPQQYDLLNQYQPSPRPQARFAPGVMQTAAVRLLAQVPVPTLRPNAPRSLLRQMPMMAAPKPVNTKLMYGAQSMPDISARLALPAMRPNAHRSMLRGLDAISALKPTNTKLAPSTRLNPGMSARTVISGPTRPGGMSRSAGSRGGAMASLGGGRGGGPGGGPGGGGGGPR